MLLEVLTFCKFIYLSRRSQIRFLHRQNGCAIRSFHSADNCFHLLRVAIISRALIGQNGHECAINVYTNVLRHTSKLLWFRRKRFAYNLGPIKTREYEARYKKAYENIFLRVNTNYPLVLAIGIEAAARRGSQKVRDFLISHGSLNFFNSPTWRARLQHQLAKSQKYSPLASRRPLRANPAV